MRKNCLGVGAVLTMAIVVSAGETPPTHDDVVKKMLGTLESITKTLASVTNPETAEAAKPELVKSAKEWAALRSTAEKLPPPPRDEKLRLEKEYKGKLEAATIKLAGEVARVQKVDGGAAILKVIRGVLAKPMKQ